MKARITLGSTYVGTDSETVEFEVEDAEEFNSDTFSTDILNALSNSEFPHYFINYELVDDDGNEVED